MGKNRYLSGNNGEAWLNGEELADLTAIESKITFNVEEVKACGKQNTDYVNTGWTGEGSLKLQKTRDRGVRLLVEAMATGILPEVTILTKLVDKQTQKAERANLTIIFTEFSPVQFEGQGLIEEELPFKIVSYKPVEIL